MPDKVIFDDSEWKSLFKDLEIKAIANITKYALAKTRDEYFELYKNAIPVGKKATRKTPDGLLVTRGHTRRQARKSTSKDKYGNAVARIRVRSLVARFLEFGTITYNTNPYAEPTKFRTRGGSKPYAINKKFEATHGKAIETKMRNRIIKTFEDIGK